MLSLLYALTILCPHQAEGRKLRSLVYGWAEHQQMLSLFTMVSKSTVATVGVKP